jgi:large subunit ribosomal protein L21
VYAIIATGGKQYKVQEGDVILVEKLDVPNDSAVSFDVLLVGGEDGIRAGSPLLPDAKVEGKVLSQVKGDKIIIFKYKSKKNYRRKSGHRQPYTKVKIISIA